MQLYWSSRSPFARKVMLAAHELGMAQQIALLPVVVGGTLPPDAGLTRHNPLGQIPTLVLEDGRVLHDSLVICEYLDASAARPCLFPQAAPARAEALTRHALGQGAMETLVRLFGERKRVGDPLHPAYDQALRAKFARCVETLERGCAAWRRPQPDIGDLTIACALAYADFRLDELGWRTGHPTLASWHEAMAARPSMQATAFVAPPS